MARVLVITDSNPLSHVLMNRLSKSPLVEASYVAHRFDGGYAYGFGEHAIDTVVYCPALRSPKEMIPNLAEADTVFEECVRAGITQVVAVTSAAIYGATPFNPGLLTESQIPLRRGRSAVSDQWLKLETLAQDTLSGHMRLTILRPAAVLTDGGTHPFSQLFRSPSAATLPLYDPPLQLLSPDDLAEAVSLAIERRSADVFNVAPSGVIPLHAALRLAGVKPKPMHGIWQQRPRRRPLTAETDQLNYLRFNWTIANTRITDALGFQPQRSSTDALLEFLHHPAPTSGAPSFDVFGLDPAYFQLWQRRLFAFLHDRYWRVEVKGIEHVPHQGRAVITGVHRGFMPYDGVMALHNIYEHTGRFIRFLIHPGLVKTPFPFDFAKLGGLNACRENADYILQRDGLLGFFPEGIQGAFTYYRDAYKLRKFGRDEYVKAALRNRAPIVPFVTVGSAEIFPVIAKIRWPWWKRVSLWPCFPIAPPFPLLPVPIPSKWHTQFLEPIHVECHYEPEAADDVATVQAISADVRKRMQDAIDDMCERRTSVFYGSIFEGPSV